MMTQEEDAAIVARVAALYLSTRLPYGFHEKNTTEGTRNNILLTAKRFEDYILTGQHLPETTNK